MPHDYTEIQTAFLEGTLEIFTELFTDRVELIMLDLEQTQIDPIYEETLDKKYKDPIEIVAKVDLTRTNGEKTPEVVDTTAIVKIPAKVLDDLEMERSSLEDLKVLEQCRIKYKGFLFEVSQVTPTTLVGDTYIFYTLKCNEVIQKKKRV